jgi:omega-6 fatty acid desaturase (delta-12 desaturase)
VFFAYLLPFYFAGMAGVWLFYVQHQFEDAYWESHDDWDYLTASLRGSSHLRLPALLRWFTGNIGVHHVHHLAPKIPNYRLQRCHDENPLFQQAPVVTPISGMSALRLALWDEDARRLVRFADVDK